VNTVADPSLPLLEPEQYRFPVSFAQQRLWFLDQLEGPSAVYNIKLPVRLSGPLDLDCLQRAADILVDRHESLRTTFAIEDGEPVQVITTDVAVPVRTLDMVGANREEIGRKVAELAGQPFTLDQGPLLRLHILKLGVNEHLLLLVCHHIVSDAWSSSVMFRDLAAAYDALAAGETPILGDLPVQYADYTVWQREWLDGPELDRQIGYWRNKLIGAPELLQLPTDRIRPAGQTFNGSRVTRVWSAELTAALKLLAHSESSTLFMVLLAAFNVVLARYTGQEDVLVGSPIAGRRRTELENLVGLFVNTLVFRTDLSGNPSFRELLVRVRATALEAYAHQELPFEKLVEALQPVRDLSRSPLFQVMYIHQNAPWVAQPIRGLDVSPGEIAPGDTAKFDLTVSTNEFEGDLFVNFEYNTDLFDRQTIETLATGFETIIAAAVANPDEGVFALPVQTDDAQYQVLNAWNQTDVTWSGAATLHGMVSDQARRTPAATALEFDQTRWSYTDLEQRALSLTAELRTLGVTPGHSVIAVCMDRSPAMVSAVLGILHAEAAYLPLDPTYPAQRLNYMLQDSGAGILITQSTHIERMADFSGHVVFIDENGRAEGIRTGAELNSGIELDAEGHDESRPAYLIYTSGSTGLPKGVCVSHFAVANFLASMAQTPGLNGTDRLLAVTTLCFDISILELFLPLTVGATTVIAPADVAADGVALARLMEQSNATVMQATPAAWRALFDSGWQGCRELKMLCGGEPLDRDLANRLLESGGVLWNMYGPTETTIWSTCERIVGDSAVVGIGRPIANTRIYILDARMQSLPVGVAGELYIGGAGVARGYLHQPELTAQRFVADPFAAEGAKTGRLYRTGDRARYLADGAIQLLGRSDRQVKIRGFRIELGEIEAALGESAQVASSAVVVQRDATRGDTLVAYVVPVQAETLNCEQLRSELKARLPDYMVPALFVCIASLPLTANGKLDRRSLPAPDWDGELSSRRVAPRGPVESALCSLFGEVLGLGRNRAAKGGPSEIAPAEVGVHDDFFVLGGHSLLATQLVSRIRDALDVELPLRALFDSPTPAGLAERLSSGNREAQSTAFTPGALTPRATPSHDFAPASYMQQRMWFLDQLEPGNPVYNLVWAMRLRGRNDQRLDIAALECAVAAVTARHEILRTAFVGRDGTPVQLIAHESKVRVETERVSTATGQNLDQRLVALAKTPFDLRTGPLLRVNVLQVADDDHVLLLVMHHIISDGWSMSVLFDELAVAYRAYHREESPGWAALPVQYADYAVWQREWLSGGELERQVDYWRTQLAGTPPLLQLPIDRPRFAVQSHRGARLSRRFSASVTTALHELGRREGCTLFMVLLAAFDIVLGRSAGQQDVVVGTPIAGRGRTELEGLIGFFVNTLVLRTDLSGNPSFRELLARVKRVALDAYAHQDLPFEKLVDELSPERNPGCTPVFQVMFNLHNEPASNFDLDGLEVEPFGIDRGTAKFDLSVGLTESDAGLFASFEYNADLFDKQTIVEMAAYYEAVLSAVVAAPELRVAELELPSARVAHLGRGDPVAAIPISTGRGDIVERFAARVREDPKRIAIWSTAGSSHFTWSYGALNAQANRVAHELLFNRVWARQSGTGAAADAEVPRIGLMAGHDAPLVAGLLGILKAGAAYVPLDPDLPVAVLARRLEDAGVTALVADAAHLIAARGLVSDTQLPVIDIEAADGQMTDPVVTLDPEGLAYILYTSGTTGEPKGVMQTHRGVVQQITTYSQSLGVAAGDRLSWLSGYGFDAAVQDIFGALLSGATLCPVSVREAPGSELMDTLLAAGVTVLHATPTVYRHLLGGELNCGHDLSGIRLVVLGGETVRRSDFELYKARFSRGTVFVNGLGLTESTVGLQFFADHDTRLPGQVVPVGDAVAGIEVELLDTNGMPGWYGEITLKGAGVARGYWHRDALTRERFKTVAGETTDGARVYRTGDIGRRLPDGRIVHVGRVDDQVKVRGYRIELGEIEAVLSRHGEVAECVASVDRPPGGEARLVAYVVAEAGSESSVSAGASALRAHLAAGLPDYMLPQALEVLPSLPRLANGKVDRARLPAPHWGREAEQAYVPARTELEAVLTEIWLEVLEVDKVGVHDDFFALGGHSLLATRLISRVRDRLELEVPLFSVFECPTVAGLADTIEHNSVSSKDHFPHLGRRTRIQSAGRAV